jgi:hypothetical protein
VTSLVFCLAKNRRSRSQWPRGLRRRSAAARLLKLWVRIPPWTKMYVSLSVVCFQVEVSATSWSLFQRSPTDCGASFVWSRNLENQEALAHWGAVAQKEEEERTGGRGMTSILSMGCRVIAQAVSRRSPTSQDRIFSQASPCGICGGQSSTRTAVHPNYFNFPFELLLHKHSVLAFSHLSSTLHSLSNWQHR